MFTLIVFICLVVLCGIGLLFNFHPILRGWLRLRQGFCPLCNSSPPSYLCVVCHGEHNYGSALSTYKRNEWWDNYRTYIYLKKER